jgi:betaine reductase
VPESRPVVTAASYSLFHCPHVAAQHGTTPAGERAANPGSAFLEALPRSLRSFAEVVAYPPNQAFIGNVDPRKLPARPWTVAAGPGSARPAPAAAPVEGPFGRIVDETGFYALLKFADTFDLVALEKGFRDEAVKALEADPAMKGADLSRFTAGLEAAEIAKAVAEGAIPLVHEGATVGCVKSAHPTDENLGAHAMLENLSSKATAVYALRSLLARTGVDPASIQYIIETSEEACGDVNQRGGGNFAKAIGELCGLSGATGSDVRSFCAGPVHGLLQAASHIRAGSFRRVVVVAGGTTAKLAMNAKKHIEKGLPVLEDCMGAFAVLLDGGAEQGLLVRNEAAGMLRIGSGSSPQAVIQDLVAEPLSRAGLRFADIDCYAPELQNPEITEAAGAGNVTLANLKMIAAMAVMKKEIAREEMDSFIERHGAPGWAPTQGHIPSGIPALGWFLRWAREGTLKKGLLIGKGSLFLGRMTGLFDGVSILFEAYGTTAAAPVTGRAPAVLAASTAGTVPAPSGAHGGTGPAPRVVRIGLTIPGSEAGAGELARGAAEAARQDPSVEPVLFGDEGSDPAQAHRDMEKALAEGQVHAAVTFHYPFPIGIATVGHTKAPGNGRDLFIATTTGTASADRVEALVSGAIAGVATARAFGIAAPRVGLLNLDGASRALKILQDLAARGWAVALAGSARGDALLRGNDVLAGAVDVLVCDSLTGNAIVKLLAAFTTGGRIEVAGSGYGPGMGPCAPAVGIISRATSAAVAASAILLMARMVRGEAWKIYAGERKAAEAAGLAGLLAGQPAGRSSPAGTAAQAPAKRTVDREIDGIDVMEIEAAARLLASKGIYCETAMGCTGPVVLVASADAEAAKGHLRDARYL